MRSTISTITQMSAAKFRVVLLKSQHAPFTQFGKKRQYSQPTAWKRKYLSLISGRNTPSCAPGNGPALHRRPARPAARRPGAALRRSRCWSSSTRAFGRRPDPRVPIVAARRRSRAGSSCSPAPTAASRCCTARRCCWRGSFAWLAAQHAFVRRFRLLMHHETRWQQGDRTPAGDGARDRARRAVARQRPPAGAAARAAGARCSCRRRRSSSPCRPKTSSGAQRRTAELFPTRQSEDEGLTRLIERLQARLGASQVQRLEAVDDHRPERASRSAPGRGGQRRPARRGCSAGPGAPRRVAAGEATPARGVAATGLAASRYACRSPSDAARPLARRPPAAACSRGPSGSKPAGGMPASPSATTSSPQAADGALVWIYRARLPLSGRGDAKAAGFSTAASVEERRLRRLRALSGALRRSA